MKHPAVLFACALFSGLFFSSCGARGGLATEEAAVSPEAHEIKQLRRAEFESRETERAWR